MELERVHLLPLLLLFFLLAGSVYIFNMENIQSSLPSLKPMFPPVKDCPVSDERVKDITQIYESKKRSDGGIEAGGIDLRMTIRLRDEVSYCVPKKLHFIWVGLEIPKKYRDNILTFVRTNPDYEVFLWTEVINNEVVDYLKNVTVKNITSEIANYRLKSVFDKVDNKGSKSDIMRYEIVYRHGGVYADTDSISVHPFKEVLTHSFVSHTFSVYHNLCNGIFGFPKGSRFLEYVLEALYRNFKQNPGAGVLNLAGPPFFTGCFNYFQDPNINMIPQTYLVIRSNHSLAYQTMDASWT